MKYKRLGVFVENKSGSFYQVWLTEEEMESVAFFIIQLHGGTIRARSKKFDVLSFEDALPDQKEEA